jgi:hypothetical protein
MRKPFFACLVILGVAAGALWAAGRSGQLARFASKAPAPSATVTPVCNPGGLTEAELDGELPGGG